MKMRLDPLYQAPTCGIHGIFWAFLLILLVSSCHKKCHDPSNPDCENYDPCYVKRIVNSHFIMKPGHGGFPPPGPWCELPETDTFSSSIVRFQVPSGNVSGCVYQWKIGTETDFRYGDVFEVDFENYRMQGNWNALIPITLNVHRPLDGCIANAADTLVSETRNLIFLETGNVLLTDNDDSLIYEGYFEETPNVKSMLKYYRVKQGVFRGNTAPYTLVVGYPGTDTLIWATASCGDPEVCINYSNWYLRYPTYHCSMGPVTGYLGDLHIQYLKGREMVRITREFRYPSGTVSHTFVGTRK